MAVVEGTNGNDLLFSTGDTLDFLFGAAGLDIVSYLDASSAVTVTLVQGAVPQATGGSGRDYLLSIEGIFGSGFADLLTGDTGDNVLGGNGGDDVLDASSGNDIVAGDDGDDQIFLGNGIKQVNGGTGSDLVSFFGVTSRVVIDLAVSQQNALNPFAYFLLNVERLEGTRFNDELVGNAQANLLAGSAGFDFLDGRDGDDTLVGNEDDDRLQGGIGNDRLDGGSGNDTIDGGLGNDRIIGDTGSDTLVYGEAEADITRIDLAITTAQSTGAFGIDTISGIENLVGSVSREVFQGDAGANLLDGAGGNDELVGRAGNDRLVGGSGDDLLTPGLGNDTIEGGTGIDTLITEPGSTGSTTIDLSLTTAQDTGAQGIETIRDVENLRGSAAAEAFLGNAGGNLLDGLGGADTLIGRAGNDTLLGGDGDDFLQPGLGNDRVEGGTGIDTILFLDLFGLGEPTTLAVTLDLALTAAQNLGAYGLDTILQVEEVFAGSGSDTLRGNALANRISGGDGNDTLDGRDGDDVLLGGNGNDTLQGGAGADTLDAGTGSDTISGGEGFDRLVLSLVGSGVLDLLLTGPQSLGALGVKTLSGIEAVSVLANDFTLRGTEDANELVGGFGNDVLEGRGGDDQLLGGAGSDVLRGGLGSDVLDGGDGIDTASFDTASGAVTADLVPVITSGGAVTGAAGADQLFRIENLDGSAFNDALRGDATDNRLRGQGGNDTLEGRAGNDDLQGGDGNDTLRGGLGNDLLTGGAGTDLASYFDIAASVVVDLALGSQNSSGAGLDTLSGIEGVSGGSGSDTLFGNAGANAIGGNGGNDTIQGRGGADTLSGGSGNDRFVFTAIADAAAGAVLESITDFTLGDRIDLRAIDTSSVAGDQGFAFVGSAAFTPGVTGQLRYVGGIVSGDLNGDTVADFQLRIANNAALNGASFDL